METNENEGGGVLTDPSGFLRDWETIYLRKNKTELVKFINDNQYALSFVESFLPDPINSAISTVVNYPEQSIEAKIAINKLISYNPHSLLMKFLDNSVKDMN